MGMKGYCDAVGLWQRKNWSAGTAMRLQFIAKNIIDIDIVSWSLGILKREFKLILYDYGAFLISSTYLFIYF